MSAVVGSVWLPGISLAPLTFMPQLPTEDAGVAVATARPAPHPAHMPTWLAGTGTGTGTGSDCGTAGRSAAASASQAGEGLLLRSPPRRIDLLCRDGCGRATDARMALLTRRALGSRARGQSRVRHAASTDSVSALDTPCGVSTSKSYRPKVWIRSVSTCARRSAPAPGRPRVSLPRRDPRNSGRQSARAVSGLPRARQQDQLAAQKCPAPAARGRPRPEPVPLHRDGLVDLDGPAAG
jgi:hypothetical protein